MKTLLQNLLLALVWTMLTGDMSFGNLLTGFLLGYLILLFQRAGSHQGNYARRVAAVFRFAAFFIYELVVSSFRVAHDVLTPTLHMRPGIIAIPLDVETDIEITVLANVITLTPGTVTIDISEDHKMIYVHAMFADDPEQVRQQIKDGLERRLLEIMR